MKISQYKIINNKMNSKKLIMNSNRYRMMQDMVNF